ncbi:ferric reductase-like transmembrane domain-containing protein [Yoonia sp. 2307UL14-13]|uniref:ferric reductase-like transmembrane domain-containing protein n=1 Tax=Yoonia sp. 2307UL14-13 TaxID=3126506 RepID=UPI00309B1C39
MTRARAVLIWAGLGAAMITPLAAAAFSPFLAWREPIYIIAGFAGIIGMAAMLAQPLLVGGHLPGLGGQTGRRVHRWVGATIVAAVVVHIIGLWITSPPDVIDVLLFRSPAPFSLWGAIAMWAVFAAAFMALLRHRLPLRAWRLGHSALVAITVGGTVAHVLLIEGTMETVTKYGLSILAILALLKVIIDRRAWVIKRRSLSDRSA